MPDNPSSDLQGVFGRPFTEQVAFFRRKLGNLIPTQRWDDIEREAHDSGFMVAGAAKADLLTDLAAAVDKAITEGQGIEAFRKDFRAIVAKNGWTGWTGEGSVRGEAWRVGVIYRTNSYTSYSAGRYAQLVAEGFPLWVYRHGGSIEPRPEHLSWNGMVLPADHPFWATHYPPSDWGCSCYVVGARSAAGARRLGGDPDRTLPADWDTRDPATGAPKGIGRGWDYAPGASVAEEVAAIAAKVRHWDYAITKGFMSELPVERADALATAYRALPTTADDARRYAQRVYQPAPDLPDLPPVRTLGGVTSDQAAQVSNLTGTDVRGFDFSLDPSAIRHVLANHGSDALELARGQRGVTPADFALLPQILSAPDAIVPSGSSSIGEQLVDYVKTIDGERFTVTLAVRQGRQSLALKTFYIGVGKDAPPR